MKKYKKASKKKRVMFAGLVVSYLLFILMLTAIGTACVSSLVLKITL